MITRQRWGSLLTLLLAAAPGARAADETTVVIRATHLLEEISSTPDSGIPTQYLREARAIMIMPGLVETQVGLGRKRGHGVFLSRDEKGEWGHPEIVRISGISAGTEAGRRVRDTVTIYRTQEAAAKQDIPSMTLSLNVRRFVSPRHKDRFVGPGPDSKRAGETLVYTREHGVLVGAAIGGERRWVSAPAIPGAATPPTRDPKARESHASAGVRPDARTLHVEARRAGDTPEVDRLEKVLAAMTSPAPARVAGSKTKDSRVSRTGATKVPANKPPAR